MKSNKEIQTELQAKPAEVTNIETKTVTADEMIAGGQSVSPSPQTDSILPPPPAEQTKRGRGRPPGVKNKPKEIPPADFSDLPNPDSQAKPQEEQAPEAPTPAPAIEPNAVDFDMLAGAVFDMSTGTLAMTLGPEWQARTLTAKVVMPNGSIVDQTVSERDTIVPVLAAYMKSKDVKDIPPGVLLALVVSQYSIRRLNQPSTKTKLKLAWLWLKDKFTRKKK